MNYIKINDNFLCAMSQTSIKNADIQSISDVTIAILGAIIVQSKINNDYMYSNMRTNIVNSSDESKQIMEGVIEALKSIK